MVERHENRNTAIFYTCGTCNLQCRYCGIDKNPLLHEIDKVLAQSFEGDYYFNRVKEYFPRIDSLKHVETWGGEPFMHMERIYPLVHKLIEHYPYFDSMYSSTNFSYPVWLDKFFGLMDCFGDYPYRDFYYCLQLSVDGPEYINDAGRGEGVTKRCIENFDKLVAALSEGRLASNIHLVITLKGTLDNDSIYKLCNKEKIIEYFTFYEDNFIDKIQKLNLPNVEIMYSIPNTAVPSPVTVEDGRIFAELVKLCREIEAEIQNGANYFKYYKIITPFSNDIIQDALTYHYGYHNCGTGDASVGFLPDNMVSTCHEGFTQIAEEYKELASKRNTDIASITFDAFVNEQAVSLCTNDEGFAEHAYKMDLYNRDSATARLATNVAIIIGLAMAGQVEECYLSEENALKAAIFIQAHTSYCIKDNYNKTGSYTLPPLGLYKLLLNGAMKYIQVEGELKVEC